MKTRKQFINLLRIIAAIFITNSHFANVWPISGIASGGMLGDVLFFAISGYCLYRPDMIIRDMGKWYLKRIGRIYITVILITLFNCFVAGFPASSIEFVRNFIYPTQYHFIASIMILYIVYYLWICLIRRLNIPVWLSGIAFAVITLFLYLFRFDKAWYHIDVVENSFIRFLFFGAMLVGAHFKEKQEYYEKEIRKSGIICLGAIILYFAARMAVPRFELNNMQILTWAAILFAAYWIIRWAIGMEETLVKLPVRLQRGMEFVAKITLQIYLVQYPIIAAFESLVFPLNLLVIIIVILAAAALVYGLDQMILKGIKKTFKALCRL